MGGANSQVESYITSPTSAPYVSKQLTALFHTQGEYSFGHCCLSATSREKLAFTSRHYPLTAT